jgi:hypothetical protein
MYGNCQDIKSSSRVTRVNGIPTKKIFPITTFLTRSILLRLWCNLPSINGSTQVESVHIGTVAAETVEVILTSAVFSGE